MISQILLRGVTRCAVAALCVGVMEMTAWGLTAAEIANSVIAELGQVDDFTADIESNFDITELEDMSVGEFQWKRTAAGAWKYRLALGSPYDHILVTDGSGKWNVTMPNDPNVEYMYYSTNNELFNDVPGGVGAILINMQRILELRTWSLAAGTETVNGVSCYKLYTDSSTKDNYNVWVDAASQTKVIRTELIASNDDLFCRVDYADYTEVEATAALPTTVTVAYYDSNGAYLYEQEHVFTDININESLADSVFAIQEPN